MRIPRSHLNILETQKVLERGKIDLSAHDGSM